MRVRWLVDALHDLEEIADHIAQDNPIAAYETTERLMDLVDRQLPDNPYIGRAGEHMAGTRELVDSKTSYIVVYRVREDVIEIMRVRHAARRWPPLATS